MSSAVPSPRFELVDTFPEMGEIEARATSDLPAALRLVAAYRAQDPDDHHAAIDALVEVDALDDALDRHLAARPGDREARTARAARMVRRAWEARGVGPGEDVPRERVATVLGLFGRAERDLVWLCAVDPTDATAWTLRLSTARGLGLGPSESGRRWLRLRAVAPHGVRGQREYLQHLTPTWGGGWDLVREHVRTVTAAAPEGSAEWSIVPYAHLTRWYDEHRAAGPAALRDPEVVAAIEDAAEHFLAAPCPSRFGAVRAHTDFAVALGIAGRRGRSAAHFARLGPSLDAETWALGADARGDLETIRSATLAEGRRR